MGVPIGVASARLAAGTAFQTASQDPSQHAADSLKEGDYAVNLKLNIHSEKFSSLIRYFTQQAQVSADGKTITVGRFQAEKARGLSKFVGTDWEIYEYTETGSQSAEKSLKRMMSIDESGKPTPQDVQKYVISYLAWEEAKKNYTQQDAIDALKQALQEKIGSLSLSGPT